MRMSIESYLPTMSGRQLLRLSLAIIATGCAPLPSPLRGASEVWWIDFPADGNVGRASTIVESPIRWLTLDSVTFRPSWLAGAESGAARERSLPAPLRRTSPQTQTVSIVTISQSAARRPEIFRAVTENAGILSITAGLIASQLDTAHTESAIIDVGGVGAEDLAALLTLLRTVSDSLREHGIGTIAVAIPAADTLSYPSGPIARVAELIVVQLQEEHRPGTPAGPVFTVDVARRHLAMRAADTGPSRLVAGIPAYGYLWSRTGTSRRISYIEATELAARASVTLARDPSSLSLHARSDRDGWEMWLPDHRAIGQIVSEARALGIYRFAVYGALDADPEVVGAFAENVRR
jgi:spore germination protein YaaH